MMGDAYLLCNRKLEQAQNDELYSNVMIEN